MSYETTGETIKVLLTLAWLLPLAGFAWEILAGYWQENRFSKTAAYFAVGCIASGFVHIRTGPIRDLPRQQTKHTYCKMSI